MEYRITQQQFNSIMPAMTEVNNLIMLIPG